MLFTIHPSLLRVAIGMSVSAGYGLLQVLLVNECQCWIWSERQESIRDWRKENATTIANLTLTLSL